MLRLGGCCSGSVHLPCPLVHCSGTIAGSPLSLLHGVTGIDDTLTEVDADILMMVLEAASAESACPIVALEEQTTLGPSQTMATMGPELR